MKNLNCKNCGASMLLDSSGMKAVCRYCKTEHLLSRKDTDFFSDYYARINSLLGAGQSREQRQRRADYVWERAQLREFECSDGSNIDVHYLHFNVIDGVEVYTARRNIIFHFSEKDKAKAELFRRNTAMLDYPSADMRRLESFFPNIIGGFALSDGSSLLVIAKSEDEYPLCLFPSLSGRHTAWIISRLENLCCVLEYSGIVHGAVSPDSIYIDPYLHQASLYGSWWSGGRKNSLSRDGKTILDPLTDLTALRATAAYTLGGGNVEDVSRLDNIPRPLADFICGRPCRDAYDDFELWDEQLIKAYGERKFVELDTDDEMIYEGS